MGKASVAKKKRNSQSNSIKRGKEILTKVQFQGMKDGASEILRLILKMCNEGKSIEEIKRFCEKSLNMDWMK